MSPAPKTFSHVAPKYARIAREIEDRLIKLIDAGEDLALYYHRTQLPKAAMNLPGGHALVIGDDGFRRRLSIPSLEFDRYASAKNAVVVRFGGGGNDVLIRLMSAEDPPSRPTTLPAPTLPVGSSGVQFVRPRPYA